MKPTDIPTETQPALKDLAECVKKLANEVLSLRNELKKCSPADGWLDARGASDYLGVSQGTFDKYRYKSQPKVPGFVVGGKTFYKRADLDVWVKLWEVKSNGPR